MKWLPNSFHFRLWKAIRRLSSFLLGAIKVLPRQQRCTCWVVLCPKLSFSAAFSLYLFRHLLLSYSKGAKESILLLNCISKFNAITVVPKMKSCKLKAAETNSKYNCQELFCVYLLVVWTHVCAMSVGTVFTEKRHAPFMSVAKSQTRQNFNIHMLYLVLLHIFSRRPTSGEHQWAEDLMKLLQKI